MGSGVFFFALCTYVKFALSAKCKVQSPKTKVQVALVFFFLCFGSKKNCVRQAQARPISNTSTHIFAAVCPGRRGGGVD